MIQLCPAMTFIPPTLTGCFPVTKMRRMNKLPEQIPKWAGDSGLWNGCGFISNKVFVWWNETLVHWSFEPESDLLNMLQQSLFLQLLGKKKLSVSSENTQQYQWLTFYKLESTLTGPLFLSPTGGGLDLLTEYIWLCCPSQSNKSWPFTWKNEVDSY